MQRWILNRVSYVQINYSEVGIPLNVNRVASSLRTTPEWIIWAIVELDIQGFTYDNYKPPFGALVPTETGELHDVSWIL